MALTPVPFDADAYVASLRPPSFTFRGRTFVGGFASIEEWWPFEARLTSVHRQGEAEYAELKMLIHDIVSALFPFPHRHRRRWWQLRPKGLHPDDPLAHFIAMPWATQVAAFRSFLESQARAMTIGLIEGDSPDGEPGTTSA